MAEGIYCWRKRGFWQVAVSLDSTHAQWRTFVSLTLVFILPMVGCSHVWSVSPHTEPWSVSPHAEPWSVSPHAELWSVLPHAWVGYVFPGVLLLGASFLMNGPLRSISHVRAVLTVFVLGPLSSPCLVGCGVQLHFGPLWIHSKLFPVISDAPAVWTV